MAGRETPLPTGVVTFLLTDIEGSTQAWQTAPDEMTAIVSRHYQILDAAVATRGGVRPQEQGEGDSIVAVFTDPVDAVTTALDAQRALRRELPDLPVRMALHTGEAMLRNADNYVGLTIIRCARIRSCGFGGQILLSDDTVNAVRDALPETADATDLGLYGLRGLDGRTRIWQLTHPDLRAEFPPLKAGTSAAGNLPAPITSFIGRRDELTAVGNSLGTERLVTVVGEPGVGKSRLAQAVAGAGANAASGGSPSAARATMSIRSRLPCWHGDSDSPTPSRTGAPGVGFREMLARFRTTGSLRNGLTDGENAELLRNTDPETVCKLIIRSVHRIGSHHAP